jgi:hypothetical protein
VAGYEELLIEELRQREDPYTQALLESLLQMGSDTFNYIGAYGAEGISNPADWARSFGIREIAEQQRLGRQRRIDAMPSFTPSERTQEIQEALLEPILEVGAELAGEFPEATDYLMGYLSDPRVEHTLGALAYTTPSMNRATNAFRHKNDPVLLNEGISLRSSNPGGEWLEHKLNYVKNQGRASHDGWGHEFPEGQQPFEHFGTDTGNFMRDGSYNAGVAVPTAKLAALRGLNNEQDHVRHDTLAQMDDEDMPMEFEDGWPLAGDWDESGQRFEPYAPFIQVDHEGRAWVNEGNHRIMTAANRGEPYVRTNVRYHLGGEDVPGDFDPQTLLNQDFRQPPTPPKWGKQSGHLILLDDAIERLRGVNPDLSDELRLMSTIAATHMARDTGEAGHDMTLANEVVQMTNNMVVPMHQGNEWKLFYHTPMDETVTFTPRQDIVAMLPQYDPDAAFEDQMVELMLKDVYQNPALYDVMPELADMPVKARAGPHSGPITALRSEERGLMGGAYDPMEREQMLPIYPPFSPSELLPSDVIRAASHDMIDPNAAHPVQDLMDELLDIEQRMEAGVYRHGIAHETEHALQHIQGLPKGSSPGEVDAWRASDLHPILDPDGDQFGLGDDAMQGLQSAFIRAELMDMDMDQWLQEMARHRDQLIRGFTNSSDPEEQSLLEALSTTFASARQQVLREHDEAQGAIVRAMGANNIHDLDVNLQQAVAQRLAQMWPRIRDNAVRKTILRTSDRGDAYRRSWGETVAELAGFEAEAGANIPAVQDFVTNQGKVYHPRMLFETNYEERYNPNETDAEYIERIRRLHDLNYDLMIKEK